MSLRTNADRSGSASRAIAASRRRVSSAASTTSSTLVIGRSPVFLHLVGIERCFSSLASGGDRLPIADAVEPGGDRSVAPIRVKRSDHLDEGLLDDVLREVSIAEYAVAQRVHPVGELLEQHATETVGVFVTGESFITPDGTALGEVNGRAATREMATVTSSGTASVPEREHDQSEYHQIQQWLARRCTQSTPTAAAAPRRITRSVFDSGIDRT